MLSSLSHWKTTIAGVAAALTAAGHMLNAIISGDTSTLMTDGLAIVTGLGLAFAADGSQVKPKS